MVTMICEKCGKYYELQPGESPDDFDTTCNCGGHIKFAEKSDMVDVDWEEVPLSTICPICGRQNIEASTNCPYCNENIKKTNQKSQSFTIKIKNWLNKKRDK